MSKIKRCVSILLAVAVLPLLAGPSLAESDSSSTSACPDPLDCTALPEGFTMEFTGIRNTGDAEWGFTGTGTFYYDFPTPEAGTTGDGLMRTSFTPCIPLPCVPENYGTDGKSCDYYMGRYSLDQSSPDPNSPYRVIVVSSSGQWTLAYENFGPVYPDMISRYSAVNPLPIEDTLPAATGIYSNPYLPVLWYPAAGVGGRYELTDWVAMVDPDCHSPWGCDHRPLYTFGGKHGQAIYHYQTADLVSPDPSVFDLPELSDENRVTCDDPEGGGCSCGAGGGCGTECPDNYAFDSVDQPAPGSCEEGEGPVDCGATRLMVCVACHASDPPAKSASE